MKKRLLSLTAIISIFMLCSCGLIAKTPSTIVKDYIKEYKSNLDDDVTNAIVSIVAGTEKPETVDKVKDTLKKSLSDLNVDVKEESTEDNSVTVNLDITGISLENVISEVSEKLESDDFTNEIYSSSFDEYSDKVTSLILESIKNSKPENRTSTVTLKKDGDDYVIATSKAEWCKAIWGTDPNKLNSLKH